MHSQNEDVREAMRSIDPSFGKSKRKDLSFKDQAIGAGLESANELAFGTLRKIPKVEEKLRNFETLHPKTSTAAKAVGIGANIAATGPVGRAVGLLGKAAAPKLMRGLSSLDKAHPVISNVGKGIGYGAVSRSGEQYGHGEEITPGKNIKDSILPSAAGGVIGHTAEKMLKGARASGKWSKFKEEVGPTSYSKLKKGTDLLTEFNPKIVNKIKGASLADTTGKSRSVLERTKLLHEKRQPSILNQEIEGALGKGGAHEHIAKALRRTHPLKEKGYSDLYSLGGPKRVEDEVGSSITSQPHFQRANRAVVDSQGGFEKSYMPDVYAHPHSTRNLDITKRRIQEQAGHPFMPGDLKRAHSKTADLLSGHLTDRYEKYPSLMKIAQLKPKLHRASTLGSKALTMPASETHQLGEAMSNMSSGIERKALQKSAVDHLKTMVSHSKAKHGDIAWKNINNADTLRRLETMFGKEKTNKLAERTGRQTQKTENFQALTGGSQTAENLRAAKSAEKESVTLPAAMMNRPAQTVAGRGLWKARQFIKGKSEFAPHVKVGLMVNPRRFAKYHKKLAKGSKFYGIIGKAAKRTLRHPYVQQAFNKNKETK
jgi:hypothetical protein